jgi:hypothetical protein
MIRAFQILEQFLNLFEVRQSQLHRLHNKRLSDRPIGDRQSQPEEAIYNLLERITGLADFLVQQGRHVVIKAKSSSHIKMLLY